MNPLECTSAASPKSLISHKRRSERKMQVTRARHVGIELTRIDKEERAAIRLWNELAGVDPVDRADSYAKLHKVLDGLRERRRILLGEPLPGSRRAGTERKPILHAQVLDVEPTPSAALTISAPVTSEPAPGT